MQCDLDLLDSLGLFTESNGVEVVYDLRSVWNSNTGLAVIVHELVMFSQSDYDYTATSGVAFAGLVCVKNWVNSWPKGFEAAEFAQEVGLIF